MSESEETTQVKTTEQGGTASAPEDPELDDILDSALPDFDKFAPPSKNSSDVKTSKHSQPPAEAADDPPDEILSGVADDAAKQFQDAMKDLMDQDPQLMQQFEQLFSAAGSINNTKETQEHFAATLQQTLGSLSENAQELENEGGGGTADVSEDEIMQMMSGLGVGGAEALEGGDQMLPLMQNMMKSLMSKEVLYPSLKEISDKYPEWLVENKDKISEADLTRYNKQLEIMKAICGKFDEEKPTDSDQSKTERFASIMQMMQEMQDCGQPPKEIVGEMAPGLDFDSDGMPKIPGMDGCSVM